MTLEEVINCYGSMRQACIALGIASQNTTQWKEQGYIPWKQQFKLEMLTKGKLKMDDEDPYLVRNPKKIITTDKDDQWKQNIKF